MIADILLSWNELTITLVAWFSVVSLTVGADFGPEIYRERKARAQLVKSIAMVAAIKNKPNVAMVTGDTEYQLGVFQIHPRPARRKHAKTAA